MVVAFGFNSMYSQAISPLSVNGKMIKSSDNNEVILRGVNLGQWLNMEGFMSSSNGSMAQVDMKRKFNPFKLK